jgi:hypothetical protein
MKGGLTFLVLALEGTGQLIAQQAAPAKVVPKYEAVSEGVKVFRAWELSKGRFPEIVILEFSDQRHEEFHKDPGAFFNKYRIFSKAVRLPGAGCLLLEAPEPENLRPIRGWKTTGAHGRESAYA